MGKLEKKGYLKGTEGEKEIMYRANSRNVKIRSNIDS